MSGPYVKLTEREDQVLRLRSRGMTIEAVAAHLRLAPQTIKNHCTNAFNKLGASNITQAMDILGWTTVEDRAAWLERAIALEEATAAARIAVLRDELKSLGTAIR